MLKLELQRAEGELEDRCWSPPAGLQHWLQLTHEIENKAYTKKKIAAEKQLQQAREAVKELTTQDFSMHDLRFILSIFYFIFYQNGISILLLEANLIHYFIVREIAKKTFQLGGCLCIYSWEIH